MTGRRPFAGLLAGFIFLIAPLESHAAFRRGVSLPELFTFPRTIGSALNQKYEQPAFPDWVKAFAKVPLTSLRKAGVDHVRITTDLGPAMQNAHELAELKAALAVIARELSEHDLGLIVTLLAPGINGQIPESTLDGLDGAKFNRYLETVVSIAATAKEMPGQILLEPMNEPQQACRKEKGDWQEYQRVLLSRIRNTVPRLPVLLTGGCWSKIEGLKDFDRSLLTGPDVWISVHFYDPFVFTHAGTTWALPFLRGLTHIPYPARSGSLPLARDASAALQRWISGFETLRQEADAALQQYFKADYDARSLHDEFDKLEAWRKSASVSQDRIVITEFGAIRQIANGAEVERASRLRWLRDVRETAESFGFGWTVWSWGAGSFGVLESNGALPSDTAQALGLQSVHKP